MRAPGLRLLTTTLSPVCVDVGVVAEVRGLHPDLQNLQKKLMSCDNHRISSRKFLNSVGFFLGGGEGVSFLVHM